MAKLNSYYIDGDTLAMHITIKTKDELGYDVEVRIDKSRNTYEAIENGFEENEIIIQNKKLEPEYVESELAIGIMDSILSIATFEKLDGNMDLEEHISSILD